MALFPAYRDKGTSEDHNNRLILHEVPVPEATEAELLASDSEEEKPLLVKNQRAEISHGAISPSDDFYVDCKLDCGNLRVSTLYYPGRPQYSYINSLSIGPKKKQNDEAKGWRRYYSKYLQEGDDNSLVLERQNGYRKLLAESPHDQMLWEAYIDFQEICDSVQSALDVARDAVVRLPNSIGLRERLYTLMRAALPRRQYLEGIRDLLVKEKRASVRTGLWARLVRDTESGADDAHAALSAALGDTRSHAPAYPRLLHAFGSFLRAAGLWERLVLAVELLLAMHFPAPPASAALAPPDTRRAEQRLQELEDKAINSGLPSSAVWVRVERARAAAHWRPAGGAGGARDADPQRAPLPHDVADLLVPLVGAADLLHLAVRLLLLAKVPLLPGTDWAARAAGEADADCAEALLPLLWASRLLPPAHPAHPARPAGPQPARLLAGLADPPHYFADDTGYESWVRSLWDTLCGAGGALGAGAREALVCWRLRWLHARMMLCEPSSQEINRLRSEARSVLKRFAPSSPLAFAEFARLELLAGGEGRALAAASHALRAAIADEDRPTEHALYIAGVVGSVSASAGECALVHAVLRRAPPAAPAAPAADLRACALRLCEERCEVLEQSFSEGADERECDWSALLSPGAGQWAAARNALASPARARLLLADIPARCSKVENTLGAAHRYYEQSACALVQQGAAGAGRAGGELVDTLARVYPDNAYLLLVQAGWAAWSGPSVRALAPPRTPRAALARLLPLLYRAHAPDASPADAERLVRAARRQARRSGGAALGALGWAVHLEAEARAAAPRLQHALYQALSAEPDAKWVYVRGAAQGGEAGALADALLERQLRLHAHPLELTAHEHAPEHAHEHAHAP